MHARQANSGTGPVMVRTIYSIFGNLLATTDDNVIREVFRSEIMPNPSKIARACFVGIIRVHTARRCLKMGQARQQSLWRTAGALRADTSGYCH